MVRSSLLRQPTLFTTLSATDSLWLDIVTHSFPTSTPSEIAAPTKMECSVALVARPDLAVEHFKTRWTAVRDDVILGGRRPLGHIVDYFWRVEFPKRRSLHIHMLLWVEDGPYLCALSAGVPPVQLRESTDSVLSAKLSPGISGVDLWKIMHPCI